MRGKSEKAETCKQERDAALKGPGGLGAVLRKWTQGDSTEFLAVLSIVLKGMQRNSQQPEEQEQALQFLLSFASQRGSGENCGGRGWRQRHSRSGGVDGERYAGKCAGIGERVAPHPHMR